MAVQRDEVRSAQRLAYLDNLKVLLVAGVNRSTVHDAVARTSANDHLPTRVTGQTISAITTQYQANPKADVSAAEYYRTEAEIGLTQGGR